VTCITAPGALQNRQPAAVRVAAGKAALEATLGTPHLELSKCSRWPEMANCGQACLSQIQEAPKAGLVSNIVNRWYEGRMGTATGRLARFTGTITLSRWLTSTARPCSGTRFRSKTFSKPCPLTGRFAGIATWARLSGVGTLNSSLTGRRTERLKSE